MNQHEGRDHFEIPRNFEIPQNMKDMAEAGFDQARQAFEKFLTGAQATAGTIEEKGAAVRAGAKAVGFAETNIKASLDYAERLLRAKDLPEALKLHTERMQEQLRTLTEQASEMGQAVTRVAMDATRPKH